ncbi:hypothetical protein MBLNU457_7486t1 [Dothideomycetes sp. NU457]
MASSGNDIDPAVYTPITEPNSIRLLKLEGLVDGLLSYKLEVVSLDSAPPFDALSYTWGCPFAEFEIWCNSRDSEIRSSRTISNLSSWKDTFPIRCNGRICHVLGNLKDALEQYQKGYDLNYQDAQNQATDLHSAARRGRAASVSELLRRGAISDPVDKFGRTPLHYAAASGQLEIVKGLVAADFHGFRRDSDGYTPLDFAHGFRHQDVIDYLESSKADILQKSHIQQSAEAHHSFMRSSSARYIWIDAICINQTDAQEKGLQVRLMAHIYGTAQTVVAWLGKADWATGSIHAIVRKNWDHETPTARLKVEDASHLVTLVRRRYWQRLWTVQEMALAKHLVFLCGSFQFSQSDVESIVQSDVSEISDADSLQRFSALNYLLSLDFWQSGSSLELLWCSTMAQRCVNEKDHVYGILGMANRGLLKQYPLLTSDYNLPTADLFVAFTRIMIAEKKSLTALGFASEGLNHARNDLEALLSLPSWVPQYGQGHILSWPLSTQFWRVKEVEEYCAASDLSFSSHIADTQIFDRILKLKGLRIDEITKTENPDQFSWSTRFGPSWTTVTSHMHAMYGNGDTLAKALFYTICAGAFDHGRFLQHRTKAHKLKKEKAGWNMLVYVSLRNAKLQGTDISSALDELKRLASVDAEGYITSQTALATLAKLSYHQGLFGYHENWDWDVELSTDPLRRSTGDQNTFSRISGDEEEDEDENEQDGREDYERSNEDEVKSQDEVGSEDADEDSDDQADITYEYSPPVIMKTRGLYATADGRIGVGPRELCLGDQIWILPGSTTPFILRPVSEGRHRVIGETYVYGVMFGEAVPEGDVYTRDVELV